MARHVEIQLSDHLDHLIDQELSEGRFHSMQELLEAALSLFEEREQRLSHLREVIAQEDRGHAPGDR
jgi:putative addiction module CopG family antidote